MSQGCPSVSHQLVAASIAFRRARKKFPKDYGVGSKDTKCFCSPSVYSDDGPRYLSAKQSLSIKQSKCTCCRRNKKSSEESTRWVNDQSAVGDVLDKVSTREPFVEKVELGKSLDRYNHDVEVDTKNNNTNLIRRKCNCCPISTKKRVETDQSKLDSVDLLYVASNEKHCHVNTMDNHSCSWKDHERIRTCRKKEDEEEEDENVRVIDHKDSISILMEKYKSRDAQDFTEERKIRKNRLNKGNGKGKIGGNRGSEGSPISRILTREENRKKNDCMGVEGLENSKSCDRCRCQENRLRWKELEEKDQEKILLLDDGRNRIRGEGDFYRRKKKPSAARSKFGVPWRHTF
ncbi:hypothetical protein M0802_006415 [Mischocyttarus mexicanus]|nr:hypothetical protein M0802_006415 [Mischocyttarus mexicanus]